MLNTILNFIANGCIFLGAGTFYIMLFSKIGKGHKAVDSFPATAHWLVKVGLALTTAGSFLNLLTLSSPNITEVIMNIGLGALFVWAALYHAKKFSVIKLNRRASDNK
jgi:hypothetical protein